MNSPPVCHSPTELAPSPWNAPASATKVPMRCHRLGWFQFTGAVRFSRPRHTA